MKSIIYFISILFYFVISTNQTAEAQSVDFPEMKDLYPWCIVAYDSLERNPHERILMIKELGFTKYAYDWRDRHLKDAETELKLARENGIEIISVWLWMNAKRDSIGKLHPPNEELFQILKKINLQTTIWISLSGNFFKDLDEETSLKKALKLVSFVYEKADSIGCKIALYNHSGWFANPYNQLKIIKALPQYDISMVYNFHHAFQDLHQYDSVFEDIKPYLSAVNLNGMKKYGPKILSIGKGDLEKEMIKTLIKKGYKGPWGVMGHVEGVDVKMILEANLKGLNSFKFIK